VGVSMVGLQTSPLPFDEPAQSGGMPICGEHDELTANPPQGGSP
jgi:hypothetical protein